MANGTIHNLGTLHVAGVKRLLPTKPWNTGSIPTGATTLGNIFNYNTVNGTIEIKDTDVDDAYKIKWVEVNDGGKTLLIADRCLLASVTRNVLINQNLISGKDIIIDGKQYKLRILTGGSNFKISGDYASGASTNTNEWDRIIKNETGLFSGIPSSLATNTDFNSPHNKFWNWCGVWTFCQELYSSDGNYGTLRGGQGVSWYIAIANAGYDDEYGWRPVLEVVNNKPTISIGNTNLGEISNFAPIQYIVSDVESNNVTVIEKIDGSVSKTLTNQISGTIYTLDLISIWDSLNWGSHKIDVIVNDEMSVLTSNITITFDKIKEHTLPIEIASLKGLIDHFDNISKDVDYEKFRLAQKLISKGINVLESDKLSNLIDKAEIEKHPNIPEWYTHADFWGVAKDIPTARNNLTSSIVGDKIYAVGGVTTGTGHSTIHECYDPFTNTWSNKAPIPYPRSCATSSSIDTKIYVIGGGSGTSTGTNECYDTITNTWSTKATMPAGRGYLSSGVVGGKIYAIGGGGNSYFSNLNECYDPVTNTWSTKASMVNYRRALTTSVVDGKIYAIGGESSGYTISIMECYDPLTNTWSSKASLGVYGATSSVVRGKIYAMGGNNNYQILYCYDPLANTWSAKRNSPVGRAYATSGVVKDIIYLIGGNNATGYVATTEFYTI